MSLLGLCHVSFAYSCGSALFADASFSVNPGDRIAVVGPNGAGKSTLLRLLSGELDPVGGEVIRRQPLIVAVADQDAFAATPTTLFDSVFCAMGSLADLRRKLRELEERLSQPEAANEYAARINDYQELGGYAVEVAVARILSGLGYSEDDLEREIQTLSGGQRARAALARALAMDADILVLDEPTNHLDLVSREWLELHLQSRRSATVLTSHDRTLLSTFATRIVELERGRVRVFEGGYDDYRRARALLQRQEWEAYEASERRRTAMEQAAERREQLAKRVAIMPEDGAGSGKPFYARKAAKVARTGRILRERVPEEKRVQKPWQERTIEGLSFERVSRGSDIVLTVRDLAKGYGGRPLFHDLSFSIRRGERFVIRGSNGCGKTTLLNLILGRDRPDAGTIHLGVNTQLANVDQVLDDLDLDRSALEICGNGTKARTLLACLKLRPERLNRPLRELSGGERTKVALARVLDSRANLLLLDEPTNHLEIEAQEALEEALRQYPGALILVSHDRTFLRNIGPETVNLDL